MPEISAEDGFDDFSVDNYMDGILKMAKTKWQTFVHENFHIFWSEIFVDLDDPKEIETPVEIKVEKEAKKSKENERPKRKNKPKQMKEKSFRCEHCQENLSSISKLRRHQKLQHPEFTFDCRHYNCAETFATAELLDDHQIKHSKVPCPRCGKMILSKGIAKHIRQVHEVDQRVICDLCGKVSSNIHMHKYHVRSDHEVHERLVRTLEFNKIPFLCVCVFLRCVCIALQIYFSVSHFHSSDWLAYYSNAIFVKNGMW